MSFFNPSRSWPAPWIISWMLLLFLCGTDRLAAGPAAPDTLEEFRAALRSLIKEQVTDDELRFRRENLEKRAKAVKDADLGAALRLQEWRDQDRNENVEKIDRAVRIALTQRFIEFLEGKLKKGDVTDKLAAIAHIDEMGITVRASGSKGGLARLFSKDIIDAFQDKDRGVRESAARALGKINPPAGEAAAALGKLLDDPDVAIRRAAADSLPALLQNQMLMALGRTTTGVEATREEVVAVAQQALPVAGKGVGDVDAAVRRSCLETIGLGAKHLGNMTFDQRTDLLLLLRSGRKLTAEDLQELANYIQVIEDEHALLQPLVKALAEQLPRAIRALDDGAIPVVEAACQALEAMPLARRRLLQRAAGIAPFVKKPLKAIEDPLGPALAGSVPGLAKLASHKEVTVRLASLYVLEELEADAAPAINALTKALQDEDAFVRWSAARALGRMAPQKDEKAVPALARALEDENGDVRVTAAAALERFGPAAGAAVPSLAKALQSKEADMRLLALKALAAIGPESAPALPALSAALADPEAHVRRDAAHALKKLGPAARPAIEAIRKALNDPSAEVRRAASETLLAIK